MDWYCIKVKTNCELKAMEDLLFRVDNQNMGTYVKEVFTPIVKRNYNCVVYLKYHKYFNKQKIAKKGSMNIVCKKINKLLVNRRNTNGWFEKEGKKKVYKDKFPKFRRTKKDRCNFYGGYIWVKCDLQPSVYALIKYTNNVLGFLENRKQPVIISDEEMRDIKNHVFTFAGRD